MDKKSLENKQVYRKSGDFQKQSITKQNKKAEWMIMSSGQRGEEIVAEPPGSVVWPAGQYWHSKGLWDCLYLGTAGTLASPRVDKTTSLFFKICFSLDMNYNIFLVTHAQASIYINSGGKRDEKESIRLLLVIIPRVNGHHFYSIVRNRSNRVIL